MRAQQRTETERPLDSMVGAASAKRPLVYMKHPDPRKTTASTP